MAKFIFDGGDGLFTIDGAPFASILFRILANENLGSIFPSVVPSGNYVVNNTPFDDFLKPNLDPYISSQEVIDDYNKFATRDADANNFSGGLFDYADLATQSTPITITGGAGFVVLPNDAAGPATNELYPPSGVTRVYDKVDSFDWTQLKAGDMVDVRLDLFVIVAANNTEIDIELFSGSAIPFQIPWIAELNFKNTGTFHINRFNGIYMGGADTIDNPSQFKMKADKTCTVKVTGWYCKIIRRG